MDELEMPESVVANEPGARRAEPAGPRVFVFSELDGDAMDEPAAVSLHHRLRVVVGRAWLRSAEVDALQAGAVLTLANALDEPVEVYADDVLVARGDLVVVDGSLGVRVRQRLADGAAGVELRRAS